MRDPPTVRDDIALAKVASRAHGAGGEVARGGRGGCKRALLEKLMPQKRD